MFFVAILVSFLASPAFSEQILACDNPNTQRQMNECAFYSFKEADSALNRIWKQARTRMKDHDATAPDEFQGGAAKLLEAQRAWIKFRDAHCSAERLTFTNGSIAPLIYHSCLEALTRERIKHLQNIINEG